MKLEFTAKATSVLIAGSLLATATIASANVVRPVVRPGSTVKPNAVKTGTATDLFAGGATLPAIAYEGTAMAAKNPGVSSKSAGTVGSAFYYFATAISSNASSSQPDVISYCQTGSGFGKKVLGLNDYSAATQPAPLSAANPCPTLGTSPTDSNGFGAASSQKFADFVGSDAPLSQADFSNVKTYSGRGQAVQTPSIAGSVAMLYNNSNVKSTSSISDATLCKIAAGKITNWDQITDISPTPASLPLKFVYRSDGSGTSFSFSNHLNAVCAATLGSGNNFGVSQNFKYSSSSDVGAFPGPTNPVGTLPSNFVGASGNPGVVSTITSNPGDIGYTEAANAKGATATAGVGYLDINGHDPYAGLATAAGAINSGSVLINMAVVPPTTYGAAAATAALTNASGNCVVTVKPSSYANITTTGAYSLIAVTNLEFTTTGNGAEASDLQLLPNMFYGSNFGKGKITTIDAVGTSPGTAGTGFAQLSSTLGTSVKTASACIGS